MIFNLSSLIIFIFLFSWSARIPYEVTLLLSAIYYFMLYVQFIKNKTKIWLMPPVLFSFFTLIFIWLGSIIIYFGALKYSRFGVSLFTDVNLNQANYITLIAISSMWLSYLFLHNRNLSSSIQLYDKSSPQIHLKRSYVVVILSVSLYVYGIIAGYVGYSKNEENTGTFSNFISVFSKASFLILIVYYKNYVLDSRTKKFDIYLAVLVGVLFLLGVIDGSKFSMILPFLYIILIKYYKTNQLINKNLLFAASILLFSFIIINPARDILSKKKEGTTVTYNTVKQTVSNNEGNIILAAAGDFFYRVTYVPALILALQYDGVRPLSVANLWNYTFMSPVNAFVPRAINPNKPEVTFGRWFSYNLYGSTEENNIGATYQGILYMSGGVLSVIGGFLLVGALQALLVNFLFNNKYLPIYLLLLPKLVLLPQEPWMLYVDMIQSLLIMFIIYKFLIKE